MPISGCPEANALATLHSEMNKYDVAALWSPALFVVQHLRTKRPPRGGLGRARLLETRRGEEVVVKTADRFIVGFKVAMPPFPLGGGW